MEYLCAHRTHRADFLWVVSLRLESRSVCVRRASRLLSHQFRWWMRNFACWARSNLERVLCLFWNLNGSEKIWLVRSTQCRLSHTCSPDKIFQLFFCSHLISVNLFEWICASQQRFVYEIKYNTIESTAQIYYCYYFFISAHCTKWDAAECRVIRMKFATLIVAIWCNEVIQFSCLF